MGVSSRGKSKSEELLREERRRRVTQLYLRGTSQAVIGAMEGVTQQCIALDLKYIRETWLKEMLSNYDEKVARELAKIDNLEQTAWNAWERSCEDVVTLTEDEKKELRTQAEDVIASASKEAGAPKMKPAKMTVVEQSTKKQTKGQAGDPRFLERISWCIEARRKLMGLDAEKEQEAKGITIINVAWDKLQGRSEIVDPLVAAKLKVVTSNERPDVS